MTNINNLSDEIANQVKIYTKQVKEEIEAAKEDVSKELVPNLKEIHPKKRVLIKKVGRSKKKKSQIRSTIKQIIN